MASANLKVEVRCKREGLLLHCFIGKYGKSTINIQEHYGLSDDDAQELLKRLDESDRQKAGAQCHQ